MRDGGEALIKIIPQVFFLKEALSANIHTERGE